MRPYLTLAALCALSIALCHTSVQALDLGSGSDKNAIGVTWTLVEKELIGNPGETVIVHVAGVIPRGWHTYSLKKYIAGPQSTKITLEPAGIVTPVFESVTYDPKPYIDQKATEVFGMNDPIEAFEKSVTFAIPIKISEKMTVESVKLTLTMISAICDEEHCKPEQRTELNPILTQKKKAAEVSTGRLFSPTPGAESSELDWILADNQRTLKLSQSERVILKVKVRIKNGWHTFGMKQTAPNAASTSFTIEPKDLAAIDGEIISVPEPEPVFDQSISANVNEYEEDAIFSIPVTINSNAKTGPAKLTINVNSQACQKLCIQVKRTLTADVDITGTNKAVAENPLDKPLLGFLLIAALGGFVSLLTPCVFPMIPITVSFFTKRKHVSHVRAARDALIFSSGIVMTFVVLGFAMTLLFGQGIKQFANNPWLNLGIFILFVAMAFNLLGYYELQIPSSVLNVLNKKASGGDSVLSLLLMGTVFSLTTFTCTGPFIGTIMVAAVNGDWFKPLLGMTAYATAFAFPFFLLALFPTLLKSLPKSGGWLNSVKVVMGLVEIAAALKFLSAADLTWRWGILTHTVFVVIWLVIALATAAYLFGKIRFPHDTPIKKLSALRIAFAGLFLAIAALMGADLAGQKTLGFAAAFVPPIPYPPKSTDDWNSGLAAGRRANKPVFFDFTGILCVNCRLMEEQMFTRPEIEEIMKNYVVVKLYTDDGFSDEAKERSLRNLKTEQERFKFEGLPFYAIVTPDGETKITFPTGYTQDVQEFTTFLKGGLPNQSTAQK